MNTSRSLILLSFVSFVAMTACGTGPNPDGGDGGNGPTGTAPTGSTGSGSGGGGNNGNSQSTGSGSSGQCRKAPTWLGQGNFWRVAWTYIDVNNTIVGTSTATGSADSYDIDLGAPYKVGDNTLYPLVVSGKVVHYGPLWRAIGTNSCGDIVVSSGGTNITTIYDAKTNHWTGVGFWYDFNGKYNVSANAANPSSHGMAPSKYLTGPFTGLISSSYSSEGGESGGCKYYGAYGTVCTESEAPIVEDTRLTELWDPNMGPVVFQYSYNYDNSYGGEKKVHEQRMEVWFFGNQGEDGINYQRAKTTYANPEMLQLSSDMHAIIGEIEAGAPAAGTIAGYTPPPQALGMQDWYKFKVTSAMASSDLLLFIGWKGANDYKASVFTAPDSAYGFQFIMNCRADSTADLRSGGITDFDYDADCSGVYQAGTYLIGVERTGSMSTLSNYTFFTQVE